MDLHNDWIRARHELSKASKAVHYWDAMPAELQARMSALEYRAKRAEAHRRLRLADRLCRATALAKRAQDRVRTAAA